MNLIFFATTLTMSLLAVAFAVWPTVNGQAVRNRGIARLPLLAAIVVVILAVALYGILGRPDMASENSHANISNASSSMRQPAAGRTEPVASVASLVTGLEARLADAPDDAKGWLLLAKTYQHLGRNSDAKAAYDKAVALGQPDESFAMSLDDTSPVDAPGSNDVQIHGLVSISDQAAALVSADDSVFVFARAVGGQAAPLAVVRRPVSDLPFEFVLTDAQAMVPNNTLSGAEMVIVTAKISRPKDALQSIANLEVRSEPVATANAPHLELVIEPAQ